MTYPLAEDIQKINQEEISQYLEERAKAGITDQNFRSALVEACKRYVILTGEQPTVAYIGSLLACELMKILPADFCLLAAYAGDKRLFGLMVVNTGEPDWETRFDLSGDLLLDGKPVMIPVVFPPVMVTEQYKPIDPKRITRLEKK